MAARPRLVQEGSSIFDEDATTFQTAPNRWANDGAPKPLRSNNNSSLTHKSTNAAPVQKSSSYKLQTHLVIGGSPAAQQKMNHDSGFDHNNVEGDDLDVDDVDLDMMMDDDDLPCGSAAPTFGANHIQHTDNISAYNMNQQFHAVHSHHVHQNQLHPWQQQQHHETISNHFGENNQQTMSNHAMYFPNNVQQNQQFHTQSNPLSANLPPLTGPMPPPNKSPLIVIDGANVAFNYAETLNPSSSHYNPKYRAQPNPRGITLAIRYFLKHNCRVQAVVPISWYKLKPRKTDKASAHGGKQGEDARMVTEEVDELRTLRENGLLVACPPGDDDDAFALGLARREEDRLMERMQHLKAEDLDEAMNLEESGTCLPMELLGGYVLSNDFFHDAIIRDQRSRSDRNSYYSSNAHSMSLSHHHHPPSSLKGWLNKHRISYSFADVGTIVDGERELEFLPNPRHHLVETIENHRRSLCGARHDTMQS